MSGVRMTPSMARSGAMSFTLMNIHEAALLSEELIELGISGDDQYNHS